MTTTANRNETTTTAPQTDATDFHAALAAAYDRAAAVAARKAELEAQAELAKKAADEAAAIADAAQDAAQAIVDDQQQADAAIETAKRAIPSDPIETREQAVEIANPLLDAVKKYDGRATGHPNPDKLLADLWNAIDVADWRTATTSVADDARDVVLATEAVCDACHEFAAFRSADFNAAIDERKRRDEGATIDPRAVRSPSDSRLVQNLIVELRNVIAGEKTDRKTESIGQLFTENVAPQQIALMLGLTSADGSGVPAILGQIIDRALGRAGFYQEISGVSHLARLGAMNIADAWAIRLTDIERRRNALQGRIGHDGRIANPTMTDASTVDNDPEFEPAFGRAVASYSEREAAKRASIERKTARFRDELLAD